MTDVVVSVVSGSDPQNLINFVSSLFEPTACARCRIRAVVNDGNPELAERVASFPHTEAVLRERPTGFAANHNESLRVADAPYVLIANDDVVASSVAVEELVAYMERPENDRVAAVSPLLRNMDGTLQASTYAFPTLPRAVFALTNLRGLLGEGRFAYALAKVVSRGDGRSRMWAHDREIDVDTFRGAFVVVRLSAVKQVGFMDEVSLVGMEETEWHKRFRDAGWRIAFYPAVEVQHAGSATVGGRSDLEIEYIKGALNYFRKHSSRTAVGVYRTAGALVIVARAAATVLIRPSELKFRLREALLLARGR